MTTGRRLISSVSAMHQLAGQIARALSPGAIVGLSGPLGAGKTEFVRGVCSSLGVPEQDVSSPSYVLEQLYDCVTPQVSFTQISHWDLYRVGDAQDVDELLDRAASGAVLFVEWPERARSLASEMSLLVSIAPETGENRLVEWTILDPRRCSEIA